MGDYASTTDVEALLGGRSFDASGIVTTVQADAWIDQAERELIGTISSVGGSNDYTSDTTHALLIIRNWVALFVSGLCRRSYASAAGDGENRDGDTLIEGWQQLLTNIRNDSSHYVQMLVNSNSGTNNLLRAPWDSDDEDLADFKMTEKF